MDTVQAIANQEREGEQVDRSLLKSVVELFLVMGIAGTRNFKDLKDVQARAKAEEAGASTTYEKDFEVPFLRNTTTYYNGKAVEWFTLDTASEYLLKCENALEADRERVAAYLNPVTEPKLVNVIRDVLVRDRIDALLSKEGSGARELLRDDKIHDVGRMFRMFSLVAGGLVSFGTVFRAHLKERGTALLAKRHDESSARAAGGKDPGTLDVPLIEDLLTLYSKYNSLVSGVLEGHSVFQEEFKNAWTYIMNLDAGPVPLPQLVASYMDSVLRDSKLAEAEQSGRTAACGRLTEYLDDKDIFQHYYEKLLSDRLLNDETTSNEVEKGVITAFKQARGAGFTIKMEGMVSDLVTSGSNQTKFQVPYEAGATKEVAAGRACVLFEPVVLCQGHWPQFLDLERLHEPTDFKSVAKVFAGFYEDVTGGSRQIKWVWARGKAELFGFFEDKAGQSDRRTLKMSMLQASVCLKFNEQSTFAADKLADELGITVVELASVIKPMVSRLKKVQGGGKPKKIPGPFKQKKADSGDVPLYVFNEKYTNPRREVEIPVPNLATSKASDKVRVDKGREHQLDAAIVRIMKTRQTLKHEELLMEVTRAIRLFVPQPAEIKKRIEKLIEKEYLQRDEEDRKQYSYLA
jgi:cullin 1